MIRAIYVDVLMYFINECYLYNDSYAGRHELLMRGGGNVQGKDIAPPPLGNTATQCMPSADRQRGHA